MFGLFRVFRLFKTVTRAAGGALRVASRSLGSAGDVKVRVTFKPDQGGIAALNEPGGIVFLGTMRAAERTAERARKLIVGHDLIDTGAMLADVTVMEDGGGGGLVVGGGGSGDGVRLSVGTPNVAYTRYQREPFLTEALAQLTVHDFEP